MMSVFGICRELDGLSLVGAWRVDVWFSQRRCEYT